MKAKPKRVPKKLSTSKAKSANKWIYTGVAVTIVLLAVYYGSSLSSYLTTTESKSSSGSNNDNKNEILLPKVEGFDVVGDIASVQFPRVPLAKIQGALQEIIKERMPLVIENSPFLRWPAIQKWKNTTYLSEHVPLLKHVYKSKHRHFVYEDRERALINIKGVVGEPLKETIDMQTKDFLNFMFSNQQNEGQQQKEWYYFADVIGEDESGYKGFESVRADIPHWEEFVVKDRHPLLPADVGKSYTGSAHVWLGQQGVVTQTHYDPTHNFYFVVQGRKRVTISPPNNHDILYLYPFAHPSHRQTQTHVLAVQNISSSALFPKYGTAEAVSVVLEEGQMLYIPPFTLHHVEALLPSISVNVWSPSLESDLDIIINSIPLPVLLRRAPTEHAEQAVRVRGLAKYLRSVIAKSLNISALNVTDFVEEKILQAKFAPLFTNLGCADFNQSKCPSKQVHNSHDFDLSGDKVSAAFKDTRKRLGDWQWAALEIVLSDYVERVTTFVVGLENVCSFLRCLALPSSWSELDKD